MKDLKLFSQSRGIKIERDEKLSTISFSPKAYNDRVLATTDIDDCNGSSSPIIANRNLIQYKRADVEEQLIQRNQSYLGTKT